MNKVSTLFCCVGVPYSIFFRPPDVARERETGGEMRKAPTVQGRSGLSIFSLIATKAGVAQW
jgi:hypothetical protein